MQISHEIVLNSFIPPHRWSSLVWIAGCLNDFCIIQLHSLEDTFSYFDCTVKLKPNKRNYRIPTTQLRTISSRVIKTFQLYMVCLGSLESLIGIQSVLMNETKANGWIWYLPRKFSPLLSVIFHHRFPHLSFPNSFSQKKLRKVQFSTYNSRLNQPTWYRREFKLLHIHDIFNGKSVISGGSK